MGELLTLDAFAIARPSCGRAGRASASPTVTSTCFTWATCATCEAPKRAATCWWSAINGDASVARLKGPGPPARPGGRARRAGGGARAGRLRRHLRGGHSPNALLAALQPEVHCKGTDYGSPERVPEHAVVRGYGGETVLVGDPKDHATRDLIATIQALPRRREPRPRLGLKRVACPILMRLLQFDAHVSLLMRESHSDAHPSDPHQLARRHRPLPAGAAGAAPALPEAHLGWVVEDVFSPLLVHDRDLDDVLEVRARRWRRAPLARRRCGRCGRASGDCRVRRPTSCST